MAARAWYDELCHGQTVLTLDLKDATGQRKLHDLLAGADLFVGVVFALQRWSVWIGIGRHSSPATRGCVLWD